MPNTTLRDRALIRLSGEDVRGFLQGLVTNDVSGNLPVWAALLTAQGKALFDFLIWADEEDVLIDCERDAAGDLAKRLTLYRLRRAITIEREPDLCVHWAPDGDLGAIDPRLPELGQRWLAPADGVSFTKGCYVGQENTARMNWRQKVNRRLIVVPIAEADAKRQIIAYPDLGWSVEHRRVEAIDPAVAPPWMREGLLAGS